MDFIFNCPKCNQQLEVDASGAGQSIVCPSCRNSIVIPTPPAAAPAPAAPGWTDPAHPAANPIAASAAAKVEMHLKVPVHDKPAEKLIAKPPALEVAARESDRILRVKSIRHVDCVEVGHDRFDEMVSGFLAKIGEHNLVNILTLAYSHIDISSQKLLTDYGVLIVYRG